jgi:MOB kinase activator 1
MTLPEPPIPQKAISPFPSRKQLPTPTHSPQTLFLHFPTTLLTKSYPDVCAVTFFSHSSVLDRGTFRPSQARGLVGRSTKIDVTGATLGLGDLHDSVALPEGQNLNDWLATTVADFLDQLGFLYASVSQYCTSKTCPEMTAGPAFRYFWQDNEKCKKPKMLPACDYITRVLLWIEKQLEDEETFPTDPDGVYPENFLDIVSNIFKRMFRVYAHCYHHHLDDFRKIGAEATLNSQFRGFALFVKEFGLIPDDQLSPLRDLYDHCTR